MMSLDEFFIRAIPDQAYTDFFSYVTKPVNIGGKFYDDPLVKIADYCISGESFYYRNDGRNSPYNRQIPGSIKEIWVRKQVADRLVKVNAFLNEQNLELHVFDAWRSLECQAGLWEFFIEQGYNQLNDPTENKLRQFAGRFCSDPDDFNLISGACPVHNSGGAVDLTLKRANGDILFMGSIFDDPSDYSFVRYFENLVLTKTDIAATEQEALQNRRLLHWVMTEIGGFTSQPYEWWHFDWGTQLWALYSDSNGKQAAHYGPVNIPNDEGLLEQEWLR